MKTRDEENPGCEWRVKSQRAMQSLEDGGVRDELDARKQEQEEECVCVCV